MPQLLRDVFETARNLLVYSWFVYPFIMVAELRAMSALEFALKARADGDGVTNVRGLRRLMNLAVDSNWIRDEGVKAFRTARFGSIDFREAIGKEDEVEAASSDPQGNVKILAGALPGPPRPPGRRGSGGTLFCRGDGCGPRLGTA